MEKRRGKRPDLPRVNPKTAGVLIGCAAVIALLVLLCISVVMRSHIQSEYTRARNEIGEEMYTQLYMLCQTFDQVTVPGQDVQNVVIPTMEDYYLAAQTLNDALINAFGQQYTVLAQESISALDSAFEAYDSAFRGGKTTQEAQNAMQSCMDMVRSILETRFQDGVLRAA